MTTTHIRHLARLLRGLVGRPQEPETFRILISVQACLDESADEIDEAVGELVNAWAIDAPEPKHTAVDLAVSHLYEMIQT